ncbi:MAG TPA: PepSY-associated TM helix domain-containing protein [Steroidobacteraceae bacterium]|nr:PepSY-associated TM helix domain-containing protein [Steroidobacteraceae bacterium]
MKDVLRRVHRIASLACIALWLVQAATGLLLVFHWEADDALLGGGTAPLDTASIADRMLQLERAEPGSRASVLVTTGGAPDRFDVLLNRPDGSSDTVRIDGAGTVLREQAGFFHTVLALHKTLLQGSVGQTVIGISGILLLTNLIIGLRLAWPRRGQWWRALRPQASHNAVAGLYAWHRALGLWLGIPATLMVLLGVLMAFEVPVKAALGVTSPKLVAAPAEGHITAADAIRIAQARFPQAEFGWMMMPHGKDRPWYVVRFRQDGELRHKIGRTDVYVDARTGDVLHERNALRQPLPTRIFTAFYPLHTGEAGGIAGRIFVQLIAIWLLGMMGLGFSLWLERRRSSRALRMRQPAPAAPSS